MNQAKRAIQCIIISIVLLASTPLACCPYSSGGAKHSVEALEKGILFAMSEPDRWRDPHGLVMIGCLRPFIEEHFDEETYQDWLREVSQAICFSSDSFGVAVDALDNPDYPEDVTCLGYPDGHETAVAIIGMEEAGITELNGHSLEELTEWLKYYPDKDQYSIGIRIQSLLYGGVSTNETWQTADNRTASIKSLTDDAIVEWRRERDVENLSPGGIPKDLLLHLAPSLLVFKQKYPEEFSQYGYQSALDEVFAFYESIMVDDEYWGFKGETFATGHILEHYAMDNREPKSLKALEYMIQGQAPNGKFNLGKAQYLGAQVHGMKGLYRSMQIFGFDY